MKKSILFILFFAFALVLIGCKDKAHCVTNNYTITNKIESDIVVELTFGNREVKTIKSNDTQMFYTDIRCYEEGVAYSMVPEILNAEMRINGEIIPKYIWWIDYWNVDSDIENHLTYTLIVTDELLETLTSDH